MKVIEKIKQNLSLFKSWRQELHSYPETAYKEYKTSDFIANKLSEFGLSIDRGMANTAIIAKLQNGSSQKSIALRADMDGLDIKELNNFSYCSKHSGKMHACGHDGHSTMLLGAAKYLSENKELIDGTIYFIFQPAEENEAGAKRMIEEGLFTKYKIDKVFGMHNWPLMNVGEIGIKNGAIMASCDIFDIEIIGRGSHAAMPHLGIDPIAILALIINAFQNINSRTVNPLKSAVISITKIEAGDTYNIIPQSAFLSGTVRAYERQIQEHIENKMAQIAQAIASSFGATIKMNYDKRYTSTINSDIKSAIEASRNIFEEENIKTEFESSMGSEDFGYMLSEREGCYVWLGSADKEHTTPLHNPYYDFNDEIIPYGISYWVELAKVELCNTL